MKYFMANLGLLVVASFAAIVSGLLLVKFGLKSGDYIGGMVFTQIMFNCQPRFKKED